MLCTFMHAFLCAGLGLGQKVQQSMKGVRELSLWQRVVVAVSWVRRGGGAEGVEGHERWWDGGLIFIHGQIGPIIGESWREKQQ